MMKCADCFRKNLPDAWVPDSVQGTWFHNQAVKGHYKTPAEQEEEQRIAMAQSRTAETIVNGTALCAEHATARYRSS